MKKIKLGIIGYGNMGTSHVRQVAEEGLVPNAEIAAVCDISEARKKVFTEKYPNIPFFDTAEELLTSGLCDSVLIAVPH